jgi:hypothetical protein
VAAPGATATAPVAPVEAPVEAPAEETVEAPAEEPVEEPEEEPEEEPAAPGPTAASPPPSAADWTIPYLPSDDLDKMRELADYVTDAGSSFFTMIHDNLNQIQNYNVSDEYIQSYHIKLAEWFEVQDTNAVIVRLNELNNVADIRSLVAIHLVWVLTAFMHIEAPSSWSKQGGPPAVNWDEIDEEYKKFKGIFSIYKSFIFEILEGEDKAFVSILMKLVDANSSTEDINDALIGMQERVLKLFDKPIFTEEVAGITKKIKGVLLEHLAHCIEDAVKK